MDEESKARLTFWDIAGLTGVAMITIGVGMVHVPSAFIVCGAIVLVGAVMAARRG